MRSIGELARASGLSVSALRFYDGAGVLVPAVVDPATGYRWYAPEQLDPARLLASLRRVGMPLAEIRAVLGQRDDPAAVRRLLGAHLRRLEDGLADARRELSRVHDLLDREENPMSTRFTVRAAALAAALDAVRFAVSTDPELPVLGGVLFDLAGDGLRLVATDRYRLAVAGVAVRDVSGPPTGRVVRVALVDEARGLLADDGDVTVHLAADGVTIEACGRRVTGWPMGYPFPDYRRLLHDKVGDAVIHRVTVDVAALRRELAPGVAPRVVREHKGVPRDIAVLIVDEGGAVAVGGEDALTGGAYVGVDREFLLDALDAGDRGQLVLELDGPIRPLAIRVPGDEHTFSILMPVRLA